jgi:hypothetical protein
LRVVTVSYGLPGKVLTANSGVGATVVDMAALVVASSRGADPEDAQSMDTSKARIDFAKDDCSSSSSSCFLNARGIKTNGSSSSDILSDAPIMGSLELANTGRSPPYPSRASQFVGVEFNATADPTPSIRHKPAIFAYDLSEKSCEETDAKAEQDRKAGRALKALLLNRLCKSTRECDIVILEASAKMLD